MSAPRNSRMLLASAALCLVAGCIFDEKEARGGHVVENEIAGTLYVEGGGMAAGAVVRVYPVDYVPKGSLLKAADSGPVVQTTSDADGRYAFDSLPPGEYNIMAELGGRLSYQDSVVIAGNGDSIPSDTLAEPGSLAGRVLLEPNEDPRAAFVQVLGTNRFSPCDSSGRFLLRELAAGEYSLRVVATLPEYTPYFGSIRIRSGRKDTLAEPIRPAFTGVPVVLGLAAAYDTATSSVRLSWKPSGYRFLKEYLVFRNHASDLALPTVPIARVRDTVFVDELAGLMASQGTAGTQYEYRVRMRSLSDRDGLAFGTVEVEAAPRALVAPVLAISSPSHPALIASVGDSGQAVLAWSGPRREADSLLWSIAGAAVARRKITGREGKDTLGFRLPALAGEVTVSARFRDAQGSSWEGSISMRAVQDVPTAIASRDTLVTLHDKVRLRGMAEQAFGAIASWEWDIGNTGAFVRVAGGDTLIQVGGSPGVMECVLRVTDDDGNRALDTLSITVVRDACFATVGKDTLVTVRDAVRLHATGGDGRGSIVRREWDIGARGEFREVSGWDTSIVASGLPGTESHVFRVTDDDGNQALDTMRVTVVDDVPSNKLDYARLALSMGGGFAYHAEVSETGRIVKYEWDIGRTGSFTQGSGPDTSFIPRGPSGSTIATVFRVTDDDGNSRESGVLLTLQPYVNGKDIPFKSPFSGSIARPSVAGLDRKVYVAGGRDTGPSSLAARFSFVADAWEAMPSMSQPREDFALIACADRVYALGGRGYSGPVAKVEAFNPASGVWEAVPDMPLARSRHGAAALEGRIYVVGGGSSREAAGSMDVFDPATSTWTAGPPLPVPLDGPAVAALNGKLYVTGGIESGPAIPRVNRRMFVWEASAGTWSDAAPASQDFVLPAVGIWEGKILLMGGRAPGVSLQVQAYDPVLDQWKAKTPMGRSGGGWTGEALEGRLFLADEVQRFMYYEPGMDQ
jgi:hypothetical protein